ncbi:MAG: IS66 family insertion sequence element accessory protein TnpB [Bacilli bacterium]
MIDLDKVREIHVYSAPVDMRMGIRALQILVYTNFSPAQTLYFVFLFVSKNRKAVKIYYEDERGTWLMLNKIGYGRFIWPHLEEGDEMTKADLRFLLAGVEIKSMRKLQICV